MHPLLAPIETLNEIEIEHYRLIRKRLEIAFKQALDGLVTPFDNDDHCPTLTVRAQRELASLLAAEIGSVFTQASRELAESCEEFSTYEREAKSVLTRSLDLAISIWTSELADIIVESVESMASGDLIHKQIDVRSIVDAHLRPHELAAAKAAIDSSVAKLYSGMADSVLTIQNPSVEGYGQPEQPQQRTPAEILQLFVDSSEECDSIEELAQFAKVAKATVYRVRAGKEWCNDWTYKKLATVVNRRVRCAPADLYPRGPEGEALSRPSRCSSKKLNKNR